MMNHATGAYISIKNLSKNHGHIEVLRNINLEVTPGELTVLIGPSGCGKSTFLRCLNGLDTFDTGTIVINGITLEKSEKSSSKTNDFDKKARLIRENVGMVFQNFNLFPHLTLLENITKAPIVVKKIPVKTAIEHAKNLLDKVGLYTHADHYPCQLSGGQQQRAAIARALAMSPKAILYDEPTSALDPGLVNEVLQVMRTLDDEGMTQIVVTHEMRFAKDVADHIVHIQEGKIVEIGTPEQIFTAPNDERTRYFLKNFI